MDMGKDVTAFRERFNAYKNGKSVSEIYDAGLPKYAGGKANIVDLLDQDLLDTLHYIHNYFSNRGMSTEDIAGIAANIFKESSFRHNAKDSAGYHGYVQMSPDMLLAVANEYGNLDPDTQLLFIFDLITGNGRVKGYTNGLGYKYGQYKTGGDAAEAFRSTFERNKAGRQQSRIDYGNQFYDYFSNLALQNAVGELPAPIVAQPDATAVRRVIPKKHTKARWTGAENVSPYLTGKPILKLKKEIKFPTAAETHKESLWKAPMLFKDGKLPEYADGKIYIKPENRGKFTALKKRTGHSASWFKAHGTPAQKKMATFALNAKKWHHADGKLPGYKDGIYDDNTYKKMVYGNKSGDDKKPQYQQFVDRGTPEEVALLWTKSLVHNFPDSYFVEGPTLPEITVKPDPNSMSTALLTTYYPWSEDFPVTGHSTLELVHDDEGSDGFVTSYGRDPWYNFVTNNCSDATREAIESSTGKKINPIFFTTPGDVKDFVENNLGGKSKYNRSGFSETVFNLPTKQARKIIEYARKQAFIRFKNRHKNITE